MMKKTLAILLSMCMSAALLCGCGDKVQEPAASNGEEAGADQETPAEPEAGENEAEPEETSKGDGETYNFTFVSPLVSHEYWIAVENGIQSGADEQGVNVNVLGDTKVDVDVMVKYIDTAIAAQADGIVTMALSPAAIGPAIDRATAAGIPVVLVDTDAPDSTRAAYVGTSNYDAGFEAGTAMIEATGGNAKIGIIRGTVGQETDNDRIKGFEDAIANEAGMEILTVEACNSDMLTGTQKAQDMLKAYPEMNAIFGSEGTGAVAAGKVLEEQGLSGTITVIGFDDTAECLDYIRSGVVWGTIVQKPDFMGRKAIELLTRINNGEEIEETVIDSGVTLVTKDNVETYKEDAK